MTHEVCLVNTISMQLLVALLGTKQNLNNLHFLYKQAKQSVHAKQSQFLEKG